MKKSGSRKARYLRYAGLALLIVIVAAVALFGLHLWEKSGEQEASSMPDIDDSVIDYDGKKYKPKDNIETLLLLGLDKFEGQSESEDAFYNDKQADFLLLLVLDNSDKTCTAVQINRDTVANVQQLDVAGNRIGLVSEQIALAHTYGNGKEVSCRNTADAVSDMLQGVKIDHYVSVTMDSVPVLNDLLDGVEVEVLEDFGSVDPMLKKGERITLSGSQALTYVQARQGVGDGTNLSRMERQRQYLSALVDKARLKSEADDGFIVDAVLEMSKYAVSNQTAAQLSKLFEKLESYSLTEGIIEIVGETEVVDGLNEFRPDHQALERLVISLFYEIAE